MRRVKPKIATVGLADRFRESLRATLRYSTCFAGAVVYVSAIACDSTQPPPPLRIPAMDLDPSLSADGLHLSFYYQPGEGSDISGTPRGVYVSGIDGSGRRLAALNGYAPSLDSAGDNLLYTGGDNRIHLLTLQTGDDQVLTPVGEFARYPSWSPDDSAVAYNLYIDDPSVNRFVISVMRIDGSDSHRVTPHADSTGEERAPSWSPDGTRIAYNVYVIRTVGTLPHGPEIWVLDTLTGLQTRVGQGGAPSWSPDGQWIAFTDEEPSRGPYRLNLVRPDGTGHRVLFQAASCPDSGCPTGRPEWTPDSQQVLFTRLFPDAGRIWAIRIDGSGLKSLCSC